MEHDTAGAAAALNLYASCFEPPAGVMDYARELVLGVERHLPAIDRRLNAASRRWRLDRMPRVDRNILRLACHEMFFAEEPVPRLVAINEAVELAKRFGSEESPGFVNAVLDTLNGQYPPGAAPLGGD